MGVFLDIMCEGPPQPRLSACVRAANLGCVGLRGTCRAHPATTHAKVAAATRTGWPRGSWVALTLLHALVGHVGRACGEPKPDETEPAAAHAHAIWG